MPLPTEPLPAAVLAALQRGDTDNAVQLLRASTHMDPEQARAVIDGHLSGLAARRAPAGSSGGFSQGPAPRSQRLVWIVVAVVVVLAAIGYWVMRGR